MQEKQNKISVLSIILAIIAGILTLIGWTGIGTQTDLLVAIVLLLAALLLK